MLNQIEKMGSRVKSLRITFRATIQFTIAAFIFKKNIDARTAYVYNEFFCETFTLFNCCFVYYNNNVKTPLIIVLQVVNALYRLKSI